MHTFIQWMGSQGQWTRSVFSDLPELNEDESTTLQRWRVVAGGLALILSRAGSAQLSTRFAASLELYQLLRHRLKHRERVDASPDLLNDVMHEISEIADPMTKACVQGCLQASLKQAKKSGGHARSGTSSLPASTRSTSLLSTRSLQVDDPSTQISPELLLQRSSALRHSVAAARTTNFAELRA